MITDRPVVLTSVTMKCQEELVLRFMDSIIPVIINPLQFAFWESKSVESVVALALHSALDHLDSINTCAGMLFWTIVQLPRYFRITRYQQS